MRAAQLGQVATEVETAKWRALVKRSMLKRKATELDGPGAKAQAAKKRAKVPKMATWEWLLALDSSMFDTLGHGLEWYVPKRLDRTFDEDFEDGAVDDDNLLVMCADEEHKQLAGYYYLERKLHLSCVRLQPPLHRRHNDMMNALVKANMYQVVALTVMRRNISYGPWGKGGNLQELWEAAAEIVQLIKPNDPFLLRMWGDICRDWNWVNDTDTGLHARQRFLEELSTFRPFAIKGPRAAPSKWMSVVQAIKWERADHTVKLMGICFLALSKGWVGDLDAMFCQKFVLDRERDRVMQQRFPKHSSDAQAHAAGGSASGASSSLVASSSAPPPSRASAKASARKQVSHMIGKIRNALMAVGRLMANVEFKDLQEILLVVCEGLQKEHSWCVQLFKTRDGVLQYYKEMATGRWLQPMYEAAGCLQNWSRFAGVVGLTTSLQASLKKTLSPTSEQVEMENPLCGTIYSLVLNLLSERSCSCQYLSESYPGILGGLLGTDDDQLMTLARFKSDWEAYCAARMSRAPEVQAACTISSLATKAMEQMARIAK